MSNWTHVAGIIRIDDIRIEDKYLYDINEKNHYNKVKEFIEQKKIEEYESYFGKELDFYSSSELWNESAEHPERFLPLGSEGSLQMDIWINPRTSDMASYTVSIFGDLRDHDNPDEIIDWFKKKCEKLWIRNAVITVKNEWNGTRTWTWNE